MNIDIVGAFRQAVVSVLESYGFGQPRLADVLVCREVCVREDALGVSIEFDGDLAGVLAFVFPRADLPGIAGQVVRGEIGPDQIEDRQDIVAELANIVAGHAMGQLYGQGLGVDITPPLLLPGPEVAWHFADEADTVVIPVQTDRGKLELVLSISPS